MVERPPDIVRPADVAERGLDANEVERRRTAGLVNTTSRRTSRTVGDIVRSNVLTRFNAIITTLAVVVLVVGSPIDALFALVMVSNAAIGIVQELRAKRTLDRLSILVTPRVRVRRDGRDVDVDRSEVVVDDLIRLSAGDAIPVDGDVVESSALEVDESALTGESDPIPKRPGDEVRSGSYVVAGAGSIVAARVGRDAWIERLVDEARQFVLTSSELRRGVDGILRAIGWMLAPLAAVSLWSQFRAHRDHGDALVSSVAAVVGLIPQGLVLLVSMAMAVAIIRLARQRVVVQELFAVEGLARIDVLCVDKTGTLTTGRFRLDRVDTLSNDPSMTADRVRAGLGALAGHEASPTSSTAVIAAELDAPAGWVPTAHVPFSSARKWSATTFEGRGTWVLGAPEVLFDAIGEPPSDRRRRVSEVAASGRRVLLVAWSACDLDGGRALPPRLDAVGVAVLSEEVREDAAEIMAYFARQHVEVKIVSGDHPETVSAVGRRLGIPGAERFVDLRSVDIERDPTVVGDAVVFGRVTPEQKRELIGALQRNGHTVAMTGDGVNDIPALKRADIGIAVDTATPATKSVAQVVLLDGRFERLPDVVAEGRRVIANMERVSSLFITKTVYSVLLIVAIGTSGAVFPFLPRHISLVSELTIGVPAFVLSFRAADRPCRPGYVRRVIEFALPAGMLAASVTLITYWVARSALVGAPLDEARSVSTMALAVTALWILVRLVQPIDRFNARLLVALAVTLALVAVLPPTRRFYALEWPSAAETITIAAMGVAGIVAHELIRARVHPLRWRWTKRLLDVVAPPPSPR